MCPLLFIAISQPLLYCSVRATFISKLKHFLVIDAGVPVNDGFHHGTAVLPVDQTLVCLICECIFKAMGLALTSLSGALDPNDVPGTSRLEIVWS